MYSISIPVTAKAIELNKRIVIEWPGYRGPTTVERTFEPQRDDTTFVSITETGFTGDGDELVKQVTDSTQGFTIPPHFGGAIRDARFATSACDKNHISQRETVFVDCIIFPPEFTGVVVNMISESNTREHRFSQRLQRPEIVKLCWLNEVDKLYELARTMFKVFEINCSFTHPIFHARHQ